MVLGQTNASAPGAPRQTATIKLESTRRMRHGAYITTRRALLLRADDGPARHRYSASLGASAARGELRSIVRRESTRSKALAHRAFCSCVPTVTRTKRLVA